ncbi:hypothetical protein OQA88_3213 [Cercophora sp. LCS_1]
MWFPSREGLSCPGNETSRRDRLVDYGGVDLDFKAPYALVAANCVLYPCVRHYTADIRNSVLTETEISSSTDAFGEEGYTEYSRMRALPDEEITIPITPCTIEKATYTLQNMTLAPVFVASNQTVSFNRSGQPFTVPSQCVTMFSGQFLAAIENFMAEVLPGACTRVPADNGHLDPVNKVAWWLTTLFNNWNASFAHIDQVFSRVALGITGHIRQNPGVDYWMYPGRGWDPDGHPPDPYFAEGVMESTTVCVRVDWRWLAFHAIFTGLTLVPLVFMVVQQTSSRKAGRLPQWKSSLLPLLYHGLHVSTPPYSSAKSSPSPTGNRPLQPHEAGRQARDTIVEFRSVGGEFRLAIVEKKDAEV